MNQTLSHQAQHEFFNRQNQNLITPHFFNNPRLNPAKSTKAGRPVYDDMEVVEIRVAGNRETTGVFPAHAISHYDENEHGFDVPVTYAMRFARQYQQFKAQEAQTKEGTPLTEAKWLTPAQRSELMALSIYTIDALAMLEGKQLKVLGMQGRMLKEKAQAYIASSAGNSGQRDVVIEDLMAKVKALADENAKLRNGNAPVNDEATSGPVFHDPMADDEDEDLNLTGADEEGEPDDGNNEGEKGDGETPYVDPRSLEFLSNAYRSMTDAQLREFIKSNTGQGPRGNLSRDRLLVLAQESVEAAKQAGKEAAEENDRRKRES